MARLEISLQVALALFFLFSPYLSFLNNKQDATQITAAPTIIAIHLIKIIYPQIIYFFASIPHSLYDKYSFHS
ncbi:DUF3956 family protein [Bacillus anthracis]|uniref:DUF3956 family protein n=1 Tax=Bacillus anthracis TaxID=1392 RepID=UPI0039BD2030